MVDLTLRETKGSVLTHAEMDTNLTNLKAAVEKSANIDTGLPWVSGTYTYGAIVKYLENTYICIVASTTTTPSNTSAWTLISKNKYNVEEISNVVITSPVNNDFFVYDATLLKWKNKTIVYNVASLSDILLATVTDGDSLFFDGASSKWKNKKLEKNFSINFSGTLAKSLSEVPYYPSATVKITGYYLSFGTKPTVASNFQIKKNGILIYNITVPANTVVTVRSALNITLTISDYLSIDNYIETGKNLRITFLYE
jgi:hypothetical protein